MNLVYETNNTLYHHGVKGMRWGHRKNPISIKAAGHRAYAKVFELNEKTYRKSNPTLSSMNKNAKNEQLKKAEKAQKEANERYAQKQSKKEAHKNYSDDHTRAKALKKKRLSQMSNAELKELNNRMQLESQYKNLKKQNISVGQKFVKDVAYESGKQIAAEYTKKYAKEGIKLVGMALSKK